MKTLRAFSAIAIATAAVVASITANVVPAQAKTQPESGYLHLYENDNYDRGTLHRYKYDSNFGNDIMCENISTHEWYRKPEGCNYGYKQWNVDDSISSFKNRTKYWWKMFEDRDYGGYTLCVRPWGYDNNIGNNTSLEDDISSVKRTSRTHKRPGGCDKVVG